MNDKFNVSSLKLKFANAWPARSRAAWPIDF